MCDEGSTPAPYDTFADDYRDHWAPVIASASVQILDRVAEIVPADGPGTLVDVGTGTGTVAIAALGRWGRTRAIGIDPARVLLEMAASAARAAGVGDRLETRLGEAGTLPLPDEVADAAISTFVLQLTPNRAAAVREAFRVLRPGGAFAHLTWLVDDEPWEPDDVFDDALDALRIMPPQRPMDGGDRSYSSVASAAAELRAAGFRGVRAREDWIEHRFTPESCADLAEHWTEDDTFRSVDEPMRRRLRAELVRRLRRLPPDALLYRRPLVSVAGIRPG